MSHAWQGFAREYTTKDINTAVHQRIFSDSFSPSYQIEISQDLQEYLAFQKIPMFGAHFYYAFSPNMKINHWQNFNTFKIPRYYVEALQNIQEIQALAEESPKGRIMKQSTKPKLLEGRTLASKVVRPAAKPQKSQSTLNRGHMTEPPQEKPQNETQVQTLLNIPNAPEALKNRVQHNKKLRESIEKVLEDQKIFNIFEYFEFELKISHFTEDEMEKANKKQNEKENQQARLKKKFSGATNDPAIFTNLPRAGASFSQSSVLSASVKMPQVMNKNPTGITKIPKVSGNIGSTKSRVPGISKGSAFVMDKMEEIEEHKNKQPTNSETQKKLKITSESNQQRQIPEALRKIPEKLLLTSAALTNEMKRAQIEQSANPIMVNAIHDAQIDIGHELMREEKKQNRIQQEMALAKDLEKLQNKLPQLDLNFSHELIDKLENVSQIFETHAEDMTDDEDRLKSYEYEVPKQRNTNLRNQVGKAARPRIIPEPKPETIHDHRSSELEDKFDEPTENQSENPDESLIDVMAELRRRGLRYESFRDDGEKIFDLSHSIIETTAEFIERLLYITPTNVQQESTISYLVDSNKFVIDQVSEETSKLIESLENHDPNLGFVVMDAVNNLGEILDLSHEYDQVVIDNTEESDAVLAAAVIQDERNEVYDNVMSKTAEIVEKIKRTSFDQEFDDVDEIDFDSERDKIEESEETEENLENIKLVENLDQSLDVLEEIENQLEEAVENEESNEKRQQFVEVLDDTKTQIQKVQDIKKKVMVELNKKLDQINAAKRLE